MKFPVGKASIVGAHLTEQSRKTTRTVESLAFEAVKGAIDDAGLKLTDIDGIVTFGGVEGAGWLCRQLRKPLTIVGSGAPGAVGVAEAAAFIAAGMCEVVVVVHARSGQRIGPAPAETRSNVKDAAVSLGIIMAGFYAQMAQRHMYEFGTTPEQLAEVAVTFRDHAVRNPRSVMGGKGPITVDDVVSSRLVSTPLHLLDCCIDNDGGYAFVITSSERARDLKKKPIAILGGQTAMWSGTYDDIKENYYPSPAQFTGRRAMEQAGVKHGDIDLLGIYDCFTITVIRLLEDLGFCKIGEGGAFVQGGRLGFSGEYPTNLDGGLLSHSHNGNPAGLHVIEIARQLWQEVEPNRQLKDPKIALCHHQGMAVLGRHGTCILAVQ